MDFTEATYGIQGSRPRLVTLLPALKCVHRDSVCVCDTDIVKRSFKHKCIHVEEQRYKQKS